MGNFILCPEGEIVDRTVGRDQKMKGESLVWHMSLLLLGASLAGCIPVTTRNVTMLSAEQRAQAAKLPVHTDTLPLGTYESVEAVRGLSCQVNTSDGNRVSETQAMEELKRASVRAGGNAVMNVVCDEYGRGQGRHNCFRAVECRGDAVQMQPPGQ